VATRRWRAHVLLIAVERGRAVLLVVKMVVSKQSTAKFGARAALSKYEGNRASENSVCI
jgi:hypothetical protein